MNGTAGDPVVFRPRLARYVSLVLGAASVVTLGALAVTLPGTGPGAAQAPDRLGIVLFAVAVGWFLYRQATVRAVADGAGVAVRNLVVSRRVEWAEIVSVRFGEGRPWVQLDLSSGDTLAVMGIQRADGAQAVASARLLATLLEFHSTPRGGAPGNGGPADGSPGAPLAT
jgi:hypothetical protein